MNNNTQYQLFFILPRPPSNCLLNKHMLTWRVGGEACERAWVLFAKDRTCHSRETCSFGVLGSLGFSVRLMVPLSRPSNRLWARQLWGLQNTYSVWTGARVLLFCVAVLKSHCSSAEQSLSGHTVSLPEHGSPWLILLWFPSHCREAALVLFGCFN